MDAIKKVLSPGNAKDDEIMYGEGSNTSTTVKDDGTGAFKAGVPTGDNAPTLHTLPQEEKKEHGILKQILNPGGDKYDASKYGGTATTDASVAEQARRESAQPEKEHGVLRQIVNPGGEKYDAQRYGSVSDQPSTTSSGYTGTQAPAGTATAPSTTTNPAYESSSVPASQSHTGRDATLAGAAGAGAGALAYDATRGHGTDSSTAGQSYTAAPATTTSSTVPQSTTGAGLTSSQPAGSYYSSTTPSTTTTTTGHSHGGADSGLSHHVHNGVTEIPPRRAHDPTVASANTLRGAGNADSTPVSHISVAGPAHGQGVYNTVVGKHSEHERDPASYSQYESASHGNAPSSGLASSTAAGGLSSTSQGPSTTSTGGFTGSSTGGGLAGSTSAGQTAPGTALTHDQPSSSHHGATGAVGASAAAIAAQQAAHRHNTQAAGFGSPTSGQTSSPSNVRDLAHSEVSNTGTGSSSTTAGPHSSNLLNKLDPRVKSDTTQPRSHEHHHGRDAAVAGGLGGAALGAHEAHHHDSPSTTTGSSTTEPHSSSLLNKLDPRAKTESTDKSHHTGRDATAATGVGAAGVGAYETDKHHHHQTAQPSTTTNTSTTTSTTTTTSTSGPHNSNLANKLDPRVDADNSKAQPQEHHYDRDAALVGGAGAAGAGLYESGKHHEHGTSAVPTSQTSSTAQPSTTATTGESGKDKLMATLGFESNSQTSQQATHVGRDATLGTGAGAAAYETDKHHSGTTAASSDTTQKPGLLQKLGLKSDSSDKPSKLQKQSTSDSHTGRDAALVGGAATATGVGAYEAGKHHHHDTTTPTTTAGTSSQYGNTAPAAATTGTSSEYDTTPTTTGTGSQYGAAAPNTAGTSSQYGSAVPTTAGTSTQPTTESHKPGLLEKMGLKHDKTADRSGAEQQTHHGRDAALVGGTGVVAGTGAYEAEKHHHKTDTAAASAPATQHQTSTTHHSHHDTKHAEKQDKPGLLEKLGLKHDKTAETAESDSHKGRDAALVGGAGVATGAGVYEAEKHHHKTTDPTTATQHQHQTTTHDHASHSQHSHDKHSHDKHAEHEKKPGLLTKLGLKHDKTEETAVKDSHHGRDAAVVGGTGAAVGAGAYEAHKHHDGTATHAGAVDPTYQSATGQTAGTGLTGSSATQPSAYGQTAGTGLTGSSATHPSAYDQTAGTGLTGSSATHPTAYDQTATSGMATGPTGYGQTTSGTATGPHSSNVANTLDPRVSNEPTTYGQHDTSATHGTHDHAAAGVGTGAATGAGAGALASESHTSGESNIAKRHGIAVSEDEKHRNKLHKEPKEPGFISKLIHGKSDKHESATASGHEQYGKDAAIGSTGTATGTNTTGVAGEHREIDPHTGLPINTGLGTGAGGTDANTNIEGYHHGTNVQQPDWKQIGKENTPY